MLRTVYARLKGGDNIAIALSLKASETFAIKQGGNKTFTPL